MNIKFIIYFVILFSFLSIPIVCSCKDECVISDYEYLVLNYLIDYLCPDSTMAILNNVTECTLKGFYFDWDSVNEDFPKLGVNTIVDYVQNNQFQCNIERILEFNDKIIILSKEDYLNIQGPYRGSLAPDSLLIKYPGACGWITLSRVGFDASRTIALVAYSKVINRNCRESLVILEKERDVWTVSREINIRSH